MLKQKVMLLSHIGDPDGVTPVVYAQFVFKNLEYKLLDVSEVDENVKIALQNEKYDEVHLVDLNISEALAEEINNSEYKNKLKVFDHHISGIHLNKYPFIKVINEENGRKECGTSIYHRYLKEISDAKEIHTNAAEELTETVRLVDTFDFKEEKDKEAKQIAMIFSIYGREEYIKKYHRFLKTHTEFKYTPFDKKMLAIESAKEERYIKQKEKEMFRIKLEGNKVGLVYAERYRSELGNYLIEKNDDLDYIILINISQRISYRGKDRADLSVISKKYGGGGHKNAAGSPLPNDILKQITELIYKNVEWL